MIWSDNSILRTVKNSCSNHKHIITCKELTFYGFPNQPDFVTVIIEIIPNDVTIELKSLKLYLLQFRDKHMSYERILQTIWDDITHIYKPQMISVILETQPRGGISSILKKDWI